MVKSIDEEFTTFCFLKCNRQPNQSDRQIFAQVRDWLFDKVDSVFQIMTLQSFLIITLTLFLFFWSSASVSLLLGPSKFEDFSGKFIFEVLSQVKRLQIWSSYLRSESWQSISSFSFQLIPMLATLTFWLVGARLPPWHTGHSGHSGRPNKPV